MRRSWEVVFTLVYGISEMNLADSFGTYILKKDDQNMEMVLKRATK